HAVIAPYVEVGLFSGGIIYDIFEVEDSCNPTVVLPMNSWQPTISFLNRCSPINRQRRCSASIARQSRGFVAVDRFLRITSVDSGVSVFPSWTLGSGLR